MGLVSRIQFGGMQDKWGEDLNWKLAMQPGGNSREVGAWSGNIGWQVRKYEVDERWGLFCGGTAGKLST